MINNMSADNISDLLYCSQSSCLNYSIGLPLCQALTQHRQYIPSPELFRVVLIPVLMQNSLKQADHSLLAAPFIFTLQHRVCIMMQAHQIGYLQSLRPIRSQRYDMMHSIGRDNLSLRHVHIHIYRTSSQDPRTCPDPVRRSIERRCLLIPLMLVVLFIAGCFSRLPARTYRSLRDLTPTASAQLVDHISSPIK